MQIITDRGYSATKPRPIQFVLARRNADTTAEADVSETDKRGTCIENPPIQYIRVKGQVYKRHTNVSARYIALPGSRGRSHSPCRVVVTYSHASRSHGTFQYLQQTLNC